jgi:hypothetical protein
MTANNQAANADRCWYLISCPHQTFSSLQMTFGQNAENVVEKHIVNTASSDGCASSGLAVTEVKIHKKTGGSAAAVLVV